MYCLPMNYAMPVESLENMELITQTEFTKSLMYGGVIRTERRTMSRSNIPEVLLSSKNPSACNLFLFYLEDMRGVGVLLDSGDDSTHYFSFGCKHSFTISDVRDNLPTRYSFLKNRVCTKCSYSEIVDSSD